MNALHWLAVLVGVALCVLAVEPLRRYWRGEGHVLFDAPAPAWFGWGRWAWEGSRRAAPCLSVGFAITLAGLVVAELSPWRSLDIAAAVAAVGGIGLGALALVSITLFNRPRLLVPPHLRDYYGSLGWMW